MTLKSEQEEIKSTKATSFYYAGYSVETVALFSALCPFEDALLYVIWGFSMKHWKDKENILNVRQHTKCYTDILYWRQTDLAVIFA